jgi:hypothetical protein
MLAQASAPAVTIYFSEFEFHEWARIKAGALEFVRIRAIRVKLVSSSCEALMQTRLAIDDSVR